MYSNMKGKFLKIDSENIFTANIMMWTRENIKYFHGPVQHKSYEKVIELEKENAILLKTKNGYYVDIESLDITTIACLYLGKFEKIAKNIKETNLLTATTPEDLGFSMLKVPFVDQRTLEPYKLEEDKISLQSLSKKMNNRKKIED